MWFKVLVLFVVLNSFLAKVTTDSDKPSGEDLRDYGDSVMKRVHSKYNDVIRLRNEKYPEFRELLSIDMTASLKKKHKANICSFGWVKGKFTRRYKQFLTLANAMINRRGKNGKVVKKKRKVPLYNRFKERKAIAKQMQCMVYAKIYAIERMVMGRTLQINVTFMSPCMKNTVTRVFMINSTWFLPVILKLQIGKHLYYFEFDDKKKVTGYGRNRREYYDMYKLINFYSEYVKRKPKNWWRFRKKKPSYAQVISQYEKLKNAHKKARKLIKDHFKKPRKLAENKVKLVKRSKKTEQKVRLLYKKWRFWYIPYLRAGKAYTILPNTDMRKPYHDLAIVNNIWEGNNPTICYQSSQIRNRQIFLYKYIYYSRWYRIYRRRVKFIYNVPKRHFLINCTV